MNVQTSVEDILKPSTYWIGNRCYRVLSAGYTNYNNYVEEDAYFSDDYEEEGECGVDDLRELDVHRLENGKYTTSFHIASSFMPYIIGTKGATKKRLEQEAGCTIKIPPRGVVDDVVVTSSKASNVRAGRLKLELLVEQARRKLAPTHYIEFALNTPQVQEKFNQFKDKALEKCNNSRGLTAGVFHKSIALHLTVGVLTLMDEYERVAAMEALTDAVKKTTRSHCQEGSFTFRIKGLEYMNDDPAEVSVLYAGAKDVGGEKEPQALQDFVDTLVELLLKEGVLTKNHERENVKLHMTVMNTKFLKRGDQSVDEKEDKETFDARELLENFGDFDFGEVTVNSLRLCIRHAKDDSATKVYPLFS